MAQYQLLLPKMGESVAEATIIKWLKQPGDTIDIDDTVLEIATDKVDSEVPSPVAGKLVKQLVAEDEVAQVGQSIAIIEVEGEIQREEPQQEFVEIADENPSSNEAIPGISQLAPKVDEEISSAPKSDRFYSPLVKSIATQENISAAALDEIVGTGAEGRLTKDDLLAYVAKRDGNKPVVADVPVSKPDTTINEQRKSVEQNQTAPAASVGGADEIIEMDRMRKLIADHMVTSKHVAPHVCSFVEADVTNMVLWREKVKKSFEQREKEKITFTPIFIEAVAKAIKDFPMINVSVNGTQIIKKASINIGMAAALPNGNLIVPVIKKADELNLLGLTKAVNDLATRARASKLKPDETQGGTFTLTNIGAFGNIMGTPIINQPQVAILAVGTIKKKPAVLETAHGDVIAIRHMMYLSLSYDHRVVDGSLGGMFVRRVADYLENWDINREIV